MILTSEIKCSCGSNKIFMGTMPGGYYCYRCGKKVATDGLEINKEVE